ncbi:Crp/Fnr family transcriptional regulator [Candidatus Magnetoovum chiemensis]|nr:Crp/Fnr family transcriptional regulator [Candidatus Magnetoovum chiemensis]
MQINERSNYYNALRAMPWLSSLTDSEFDNIIDRIHIKQFAKGDVVIFQENTGSIMYMLLDGEVKVTVLKEDGTEIVIARRGKGEYFGEMSLIDDKTTSATVMAVTDSIIALVSKKNFYYLLYSNKTIFDDLLKTLCYRLRCSIDTIQMLSNNYALERVGMLFNQLSKRYGIETEEGVFLNIKLTHQDIAHMTGMARQTVTRVIDDMKQGETIRFDKNDFILLKHKFFEDFSSLSP